MGRAMDRLHSMRVFARVVDEGSFAKAAREMKLSAAVVTRLVADLEDHLGARLINRTTRRLALTDIGELYLERVRDILTEVEDAEAQAGAAASGPRGHLRVLVPPAFAVHQLAGQLPAFRALCPLVTLELAVPGGVGTVDENFDLTILTSTSPALDGDFSLRRLAWSEAVLCASPGYLDTRGRPRHPDELLRHEVMLPSSTRELGWRRVPDGASPEAVESVSLRLPRSALSTFHSDTARAAALAGMGLALLPSFVVEADLRARTLERVLPEWRQSGCTIQAAVPTRRHVPARTRAFVDFLVARFGGEERDPWLAVSGSGAG